MKKLKTKISNNFQNQKQIHIQQIKYNQSNLLNK